MRDWKEHVWYCRKEDEPLATFNSYWQPGGADIRDHICTGVGTSVTRIKKADVDVSMTEENLLTIGFRKATQWAFMQAESTRRLGREMRGQIHIDITASSEVQPK